jgi:hypothetical protein
MAKQTINIGASPNDGTGTPLRTSFDYCNLNFTELYTATGPSGNNIVVPGNATITGDLTVDTSTLKVDSTNNRVGIGTASPASGYVLDVVGAARITAANGLILDKAGAGFVEFRNSGNAGANVGTSGTGGLTIYTADGAGGAFGVRYVIGSTGISTWSVAGTTAMTLNSTGLGIGVASPAQKLTVLTNIGISATTAAAADDRLIFTENMPSANLGSQIVWKTASSGNAYASIGITNGAAGNTGTLIFSTSSSIFGSNNVERVRIKPTGQVRFFPLAADPAGAETGDVYYNSVSNKLKCYNGTIWNDLF